MASDIHVMHWKVCVELEGGGIQNLYKFLGGGMHIVGKILGGGASRFLSAENQNLPDPP